MTAPMTGTEHAEDPRPMHTEQLGTWRHDPTGGVVVPLSAVGPAPLDWLKWLAPYLDPSLAPILGTFDPPVVMWPNIAGALRCSDRKARYLASEGRLIVSSDGYRTWTTAAEIWHCHLPPVR